MATATAIAGLLIGLVTGLAVAREEFDPAEAGHQLEAMLASAAASLEVAAVEYQESVDQDEVTKQAEFEGSLAALASSRETFSEVRPAIGSLFPHLIEPIEDLYEEVERSMTTRNDSQEVVSLLERLEALLKGETSS